MAKLSLSVAPNDVETIGLGQVVSLLLVSTKVGQRVREHALMQGQRRLARENITPREMILYLL
jgi:hypothetical protein